MVLMWQKQRFTGWLNVEAQLLRMHRIGDKVESPLIETGKADVLVGFEILGNRKSASNAKEKGQR